MSLERTPQNEIPGPMELYYGSVGSMGPCEAGAIPVPFEAGVGEALRLLVELECLDIFRRRAPELVLPDRPLPRLLPRRVPRSCPVSQVESFQYTHNLPSKTIEGVSFRARQTSLAST